MRSLLLLLFSLSAFADDVVVTPCRSGVPTYGFYDYHTVMTVPNNGTPEVYNGVVLVGCYATQSACDQARTAYPNGTVSQPVGSPQVGVMSYAHNHSACFLMQD